MNIAIIGDIHGCVDKLEQLLDKLQKRNVDKYIFVGDYFDRGQYSNKVFEKLKQLKNDLKENCILCYGNHEDMMLRWFYNRRYASNWFNNGGQETLYSFGAENLAKDKLVLNEVVNFIETNVEYLHEEELFSCCHALPIENFNEQSEDDLDSLIWDRHTFRHCLYDGKLGFIGHTPLDNPIRSYKQNYETYQYNIEYDLPETGLVDVDTAAVFNGKLTSCIVNTDTKKMIFINNED